MKKLLPLLLALVLVFGLIPSLAEEETPTSYSGSKNFGVNVEYTFKAQKIDEYFVEIPATVTIDSQTRVVSLPVTVTLKEGYNVSDMVVLTSVYATNNWLELKNGESGQPGHGSASAISFHLFDALGNDITAATAAEANYIMLGKDTESTATYTFTVKILDADITGKTLLEDAYYFLGNGPISVQFVQYIPAPPKQE